MVEKVSVLKSNLGGLGLFANENLQEGLQVFEDIPLFSIQHTPNKRLCSCCAHCGRFVGNLAHQIETIFGEDHFSPMLINISGHIDKWQKIYQDSSSSTQDPVRCPSCSEIYCSEGCRQAAWNHNHEILCVANERYLAHQPSYNVANKNPSSPSPLYDFKLHAIESADTLLLAAQLCANIVLKVRENLIEIKNTGKGCADVMHTFALPLINQLMGFINDEFDIVCRPPADGRGKDEEFKQATKETLERGYDLFSEYMTNYVLPSMSQEHPEMMQLKEMFTPREFKLDGYKFFSKCLGMFELNNIDLQIESPMEKMMKKLLETSNPATNQEVEKQAVENLLREKEVVMRCLWTDEMTGNYADDDSEYEDEDDEAMEMEGSCMTCDDSNGRPTIEFGGLKGGYMGPAISGEVSPGRTMNTDDAGTGGMGESEFLQEVRKEMKEIPLDELLENATTWPRLHGTAFSAKIARINHSCRPNVKFYFDNGDFRIQAKAVRPIQSGDEITICYCTEGDSLKKRRAALKEYGFICNCPRCVEEEREESITTEMK